MNRDRQETIFSNKLNCSEHIFDISFNPLHNNLLLASTVSGKVFVYNLSDFPVTFTVQRPSKVSCRTCRWIGPNNCFVSGHKNGKCVIFDISSVSSVWSSKMPGGVSSVEVASGDVFVAGDDEGYMSVFDRRGARSQVSIYKGEDFVAALRVLENGYHFLASCGEDLLLLDTRVPRSCISEWSSEDGIMSICLADEQSTVLCSDENGYIKKINLKNPDAPMSSICRHPDPIETMVEMNNYGNLLTGCHDGFIRVVSASTNNVLGIVATHSDPPLPIEKVAFSSAHDIIGSISHDDQIRLIPGVIAFNMLESRPDQVISAHCCNLDPADDIFDDLI